METPKAEIIKLNLDCQGTHYPQSEIDELERRATESSLWEERFHNAAQANARLEVLLEKATEALKAVYDDGICQDSVNEVDCLNCEWCKVKEVLDVIDGNPASIKL